MNRSRAGLAAAMLAFSLPALAHHAPNSYLRLDFRAQAVLAEFLVPQSELAYAMNGTLSAAALGPYLLRHVGAATPDGAAWTVTVTEVRTTAYLDQPCFVASLTLKPPAGSSPRDFLLTTDVITHEVRNHVVVVVATRDSADASLANAPVMLGALQHPARQLLIRRPLTHLAAAKHTRRESDDGAQQPEHTVHGDSEQPERQRDQPDQGP